MLDNRANLFVCYWIDSSSNFLLISYLYSNLKKFSNFSASGILENIPFLVTMGSLDSLKILQMLLVIESNLSLSNKPAYLFPS